MKLLFQILTYSISAQVLITQIYFAQAQLPQYEQKQGFLSVKKASVKKHANQEQVDACADCHPDIVESFRQTHMSRAMASPKTSLIIEDFDPLKSTVIHPKTGVGYRAYIDEKGQWWQEEFDPKGTYTRQVQVKYLIGSGNNTRSYIGEVEGELIELPLTWYSATRKKAGLWDMSPGYHRNNHYRFSRPVKGDCLFCHNDLARIDSDGLAKFKEALPEGITCVRCHGDGNAHINARLDGFEPVDHQPDPYIYNSKYESSERQNQLCEQCHLSGEARSLLPKQSWDKYDPRTPLQDYLQIYAFPLKENNHQLKANLSFGIASHSERMKLSSCAQKSKDFTCTTCHNPHGPDRSDSYQIACTSCHQNDLKHEQEGPRTNKSCTKENKQHDENKLCYECHMKQGGTSDIPHVSMTDHWIRKTITEEPLQELAYTTELKPLLPALNPKNKKYETALLGLAYADLVRYNQRTEFTQKALNLLVKAAQEHPSWPEIWSSLGELSNTLGDPVAASAAYSRYSDLRPNDEYYRLKEVTTLNLLSKDLEAEKILTELIQTSPLRYRPIEQLANLRFKQQNFDEASTLYQKASQLAPYAHSPLFNHGFMMLIKGDLTKARELVNQGRIKDGVGKEGPFYLGLIEAAEHHYDLATRYLEEAIKRDPNYVLAYQQLARIYYENKAYEKAIQSLKLWIEKMPNYLDARFILAQYLDAQKRYQEAYEVLKEAAQTFRDPRLAQALHIATQRLSLIQK